MKNGQYRAPSLVACEEWSVQGTEPGIDGLKLIFKIRCNRHQNFRLQLTDGLDFLLRNCAWPIFFLSGSEGPYRT